jgi:transcriptional regulator with XRE-family HTH domain
MNTMLQRKPQAALRLSSLSDEDKRRLSRLIAWTQEELGHNNTQMARLLGCAPSSLGCFLNQERNKVHINFLEKLASIIGISVESVQELIHADSGWSLTHRITVLRSKYKDTRIERRDIELESNEEIDPLASITKEMLSLPIEVLPQVIEMAVARLRSAALEHIDGLPQAIDVAVKQLTAAAVQKEATRKSGLSGGSNMSNKTLRKRERVLLAQLVWASWQERNKRGMDIPFPDDSFLATLVYSRGEDFLAGLDDSIYSFSESDCDELDEVARFCLKAKWANNAPRICKMESYSSWDELMETISSVNGAFSLH